jgi:cation transport protein ChaC
MPHRHRSPRPLHLTEAHIARVHRAVPDTGLHDYPELRLLSGSDKAEAAQRLLAQNDGRPFWVFGYGSLIWKPAFDHVEQRRVTAWGWRRSFCLEIENWRATRDEPGLMLALVTGGSCAGMAYRLPPDDPQGRMLRLLEREVSYHEDVELVRWLTVRDAAGETLRALTFYAAPLWNANFTALPIEEQAARLARAVGHVGSCAEYLRNTVQHLEDAGIRDRYMWRLQQMVAAEIAARHPDLASGATSVSRACSADR